MKIEILLYEAPGLSRVCIPYFRNLSGPFYATLPNLSRRL